MKQIPVFLLLFISFTASAVEVAPRISDREIIESLADIKAELKAGQQLMNQRFELMNQRFEQVDQRFEQVDRRFEQVNQRFEQVDQRFEQVDQRFEQMQAAMNHRFEQVDYRFEQFGQQFNNMNNTMLAFFATVVTLIATLFGYIIWDRRTALKPLEERFNALEKDLIYDLQLRDEGGSLLTRLLHAMRGLAQEDPKVAQMLKTFSLL